MRVVGHRSTVKSPCRRSWMSENGRRVCRLPSRPSAPPWPPKAGKSRPRPRPSRYVAELISADTDREKAIRWLIALMVLCCDPLAIALTAAASARRSNRCQNPHLVRSTFNSCHADAIELHSA
jgi:hypothetical protein